MSGLAYSFLVEVRFLKIILMGPSHKFLKHVQNYHGCSCFGMRKYPSNFLKRLYHQSCSFGCTWLNFPIKHICIVICQVYNFFFESWDFKRGFKTLFTVSRARGSQKYLSLSFILGHILRRTDGSDWWLKLKL